MLARYPAYDPKLDNPAAEEAYELVMGCSKGTRSLMAEYALKDEVQGESHCLAYTFKPY